MQVRYKASIFGSARRIHRTMILSVMLVLLMGVMPSMLYGQHSRIKDIARIIGLDDIDLIGYGLVGGLGGSGDKDLTLTQQTTANLLSQFQITIPPTEITGQNVAAVMVTARMDPFYHAGDRVDVSVMSIGDAESLSGGTLFMTPLLAPDGTVYALAQGALTVGGFSVGAGGAGGQQLTRNIPTTGRVPNGAIVRFDDKRPWARDGVVSISLHNPDFTTATRVASAINDVFPGSAGAQNAATVDVNIPEDVLALGRLAGFVAKLQEAKVQTDMQSKLILNERTGTIVVGGNVHIHPAVVAHGNLTVSIKSSLGVSQPPAFSDGTTVVVEDQQTQVEAEQASVMLLPEVITVQSLADTLNQMGGTPQDLISILQSLHRLGAIQVEIETM